MSSVTAAGYRVSEGDKENYHRQEVLDDELSEEWISQPSIGSRQTSTSFNAPTYTATDTKKDSASTFRILQGATRGLQEITPQWKNGPQRDLFSKPPLERLFEHRYQATPPLPSNVSASISVPDFLHHKSSPALRAFGRIDGEMAAARDTAAIQRTVTFAPNGTTFTFSPPSSVNAIQRPQTPEANIQKKPSPSKSPLKLFQNYDTYTTNHLTSFISNSVADTGEIHERTPKRLRKTISSPNLPSTGMFPRDPVRKGSVTTSDFINEAEQIMGALRQNNPIKSHAISTPMSKISEGRDPETSPRIVEHETPEPRSHFSDWSTASARSRNAAIAEQQHISQNVDAPGDPSQSSPPANVAYNSIKQRWETSAGNLQVSMKSGSYEEPDAKRNEEPSEKPTGATTGSRGGSTDTVLRIDPAQNMFPEAMGSMIYDREQCRWVKRTPVTGVEDAEDDDVFKDIEDLASSSQVGHSSRQSVVIQRQNRELDVPFEKHMESHSKLSFRRVSSQRQEEKAHGLANISSADVRSQQSFSSSHEDGSESDAFSHLESNADADGDEDLDNGAVDVPQGSATQVPSQNLDKNTFRSANEESKKMDAFGATLERLTLSPVRANLTFSTPGRGLKARSWDSSAKNIQSDVRDRDAKDDQALLGLETPAHNATNKSLGKLFPPSTARKQLMLSVQKKEFAMPETPYARDVAYVGRRHKTFQEQEQTFTYALDDLVRVLTEWKPFEPHWEKTRSIRLPSKNLETLVKLDFFLPILEELDVKDNRLGYLTGIPESVRQLDVSRNCLFGLTDFSHLRNLQYLDVSHNNLDNLDALSMLVHLRELNASENSLTDLSGIFHLDGLIKVTAKRNQISEFNISKSCRLFRLEELNLSSNGLKSIKGLKSLTRLMTLELGDNLLANIDFGAKRQQIRSVKLSYNRLTSFDAAWVPNVRILELSYNRLPAVENLASARNLEILAFQGQQVKRLNLRLHELQDVKKLYLSNNPLLILTLEPIFYNLRSLELAGTQLFSLPADFVAMVPNIRILNLNNNALSDISALRSATRLRRLMLLGNRIESMDHLGTVLPTLPSLEALDVRMNPLTLSFYPPPLPTLPYSSYGGSKAASADSEAKVTSYRPESAREAQELWDNRDTLYRRDLPPVWNLRRKTYQGIVFMACPRLRWFDGSDVIAKNVEAACKVVKSINDRAQEQRGSKTK